MRHFKLEIIIKRTCRDVYEHLATPVNFLGLQPLLTSLDALPEQQDENGVTLRPFYTVETFRWLGIPIINNRIHSTTYLVDPHKKLKHVVHSKPGIEIEFVYLFEEKEGSTHLIQTVDIRKVHPFLENFVYREAVKAQRAVLANLKSRLEGQAA
jgi:hypothetical protein